MEYSEFMSLPTAELSRLVQESRQQVCCFPINGTRRWYLFEARQGDDYIEKATRRHIEIYRMLFEHGMTTILAPMFGDELLSRGPEYLELAIQGLSWLATDPQFLEFYREAGIRVHFYGDYRKKLAATPYANLCNLFDQVTRQTAQNDRYRLFFGVFASNANETVAEYSIQHHSETGLVPTDRQIIEMYYGEYVGPVSIFIGFDKYWVFDMPLLSTESTDIYFTVSPSLYLNEIHLRRILFDHLFARYAAEPDYGSLSPDARKRMKAFYDSNAETIFGVGKLTDGIWYPLHANPAAET